MTHSAVEVSGSSAGGGKKAATRPKPMTLEMDFNGKDNGRSSFILLVAAIGQLRMDEHEVLVPSELSSTNKSLKSRVVYPLPEPLPDTFRAECRFERARGDLRERIKRFEHASRMPSDIARLCQLLLAPDKEGLKILAHTSERVSADAEVLENGIDRTVGVQVRPRSNGLYSIQVLLTPTTLVNDNGVVQLVLHRK